MSLILAFVGLRGAYLISVTTGTTKAAGSEDPVSLVLVGNEGATETLQLDNTSLQPGSTDTFTLQGRDVCLLYTSDAADE